MAKTTQTQPTTNGQSFAYAVGQDIAALKAAVEELKKGSELKTIKVTIPAKPEKYHNLTSPLEAIVEIPTVFKNSVCIIVDQDQNASLVYIADTFKYFTQEFEQVLHLTQLAKVDLLDASVAITGVFDQEQLKQIENDFAHRQKNLDHL